MKIQSALKIAGTITAIAVANTLGLSKGMPPEQRETIHGLFDSHKSFSREVEETEKGYVSRTTSDDPDAVKLLQSHVKQMEKRMKDGLMVRGWDPAYVEFVNHYDDIDIQITNISNGISVAAVGKTPEAIAVARNHAGIISEFINNGWKEHDNTHAAVYEESTNTKGKYGMGNMSCCQMGSEDSGEGKGACDIEGEGSCSSGGHSESDAQNGMSCCQKAG